MSKDNPGVLHDATNSWNGYNHQGKIALFYAVREIVRLLGTEPDRSIAYAKLGTRFLEIEFTEDFSTGTLDADGNQIYQTVHQVKDRQDTGLSKYESAIQGLAVNLVRHPEVENAYLHVTVKVSTVPKDKLFVESVEDMVKKMDWLDEQECNAQKEEDPVEMQKKLDDLKKLRAGLQKILGNKKELSKIQKYSYEINGGVMSYCPKDEAKCLVKKSLLDFYCMHDPTVDYKHGEDFINKSYQYLLEKLNDHVVYRAKNYGEKNAIRYILFSQLYEWLVSPEIERMGDDYYLYYIKTGYFEYLDRFCSNCKLGTCETCQIPAFKGRLRCMKPEELRSFICQTNPHVPSRIGIEHYHEFLQRDGIKDPFWNGLRRIPQKPEDFQNSNTVKYAGSDKQTYILTTLAIDSPTEDEEDEESVREEVANEVKLICTEIYKNQTKRGLCLEGNCLLSKNFDVKSVQDRVLSLKPSDIFRDRNNITSPSQVRIVPMKDFKSNYMRKEYEES